MSKPNFQQWLVENKRKWEYVYHVSPKSDIRKLRAFGQSGNHVVDQKSPGVYVAPTFKDAVAWAISYVSHKKSYMKMPRSYRKDDEKPNKRYHEKPSYYKNITIYKLRVPSDVVRQSWGLNFWEPEIFIAEDDLSDVEIVSQKTYPTEELWDLHDRQRKKESEYRQKDTDNAIADVTNTNLAAQEYLRLKNELANRVLKQGKSINLERAKDLIDKLKLYLYDNTRSIYGEIKPNISPQEEQKVKDTVRRVEQLLNSQSPQVEPLSPNQQQLEKLKAKWRISSGF